MRISFRHKYVMFDVPKSASTSINLALQHASECTLDGNGGVKHMTVADYEEYLEPFLKKRSGMDIGTLERIAVVREPFDMLASYYKYRRRPGVENASHVDHSRNTCGVSFSAFLEDICKKEGKRYVVTRPSSFILDPSKKVGIDLLFSFERLDALAKYLTSKTGQEIEIPRRNVSAQLDIGLVERDLLDRVRNAFEDDFILHEAIMHSPHGEPLRVRHHGLAELQEYI
ncbi:MAG: hypothetical protein ABJM26_05415 [Anderseniella sp.]